MIDWDATVSGWGVTFSAALQVSAILLTALLTWFLSLASDKRRARLSLLREQRAQQEQYLRDIYDLTESLDQLAMRKEGLSADVMTKMTRFLERVYWVPSAGDRIVDVWVRTQMSLGVLMISNHDEENTWDDLTQHSVREHLRSIHGRFTEWQDGKTPVLWFAEEMEQSTMKVFHGRVGSLDDFKLTRADAIRDVFRIAKLQLRAARKLPTVRMRSRL